MNTLQFFTAFFSSIYFVTLAFTYLVTHSIKIWTSYYATKEWRVQTLWETGGMPSSHTAITVALVIALGFDTGPSPLFFTALVFCAIVIRDSTGVRASVGEQAKLLNVISGKLQVHKKVKLVLGHTPLQALIGGIIGLAVGIICSLVY